MTAFYELFGIVKGGLRYVSEQEISYLYKSTHAQPRHDLLLFRKRPKSLIAIPGYFRAPFLFLLLIIVVLNRLDIVLGQEVPDAPNILYQTVVKLFIFYPLIIKLLKTFIDFCELHRNIFEASIRGDLFCFELGAHFCNLTNCSIQLIFNNLSGIIIWKLSFLKLGRKKPTLFILISFGTIYEAALFIEITLSSFFILLFHQITL